jgi:lantibiotic modifying enzyme
MVLFILYLDDMEKIKRIRIPAKIQVGILVYSTNIIQLGCIRELTIAHYYNRFTYTRVKRVVFNQ